MHGSTAIPRRIGTGQVAPTCSRPPNCAPRTAATSGCARSAARRATAVSTRSSVAIRDAYLHISGVGSLNQLQCTFDMPPGRDATIGGYRLELFYDDDEARVNGRKMEIRQLSAIREQVRGRTAARSCRVGREVLSHRAPPARSLGRARHRARRARLSVPLAKPGCRRYRGLRPGTLGRPLRLAAAGPAEAVTMPARAGRRARFRLGI